MANHEPLPDSRSHRKEFAPFLDDLSGESERGAVLISVSYLEQQLKEIVSAFLCEGKASVRLFKGLNAPLGTFAARADAAAALGLISEREYRELETLRKIRNQFAHDHRASFSDQSIVDLCGNLSFSTKNVGRLVALPLGQFNTAALALILNLTNRAHYVSKKRLNFEDWPN